MDHAAHSRWKWSRRSSISAPEWWLEGVVFPTSLTPCDSWAGWVPSSWLNITLLVLCGQLWWRDSQKWCVTQFSHPLTIDTRTTLAEQNTSLYLVSEQSLADVDSATAVWRGWTSRAYLSVTGIFVGNSSDTYCPGVEGVCVCCVHCVSCADWDVVVSERARAVWMHDERMDTTHVSVDLIAHPCTWRANENSHLVCGHIAK